MKPPGMEEPLSVASCGLVKSPTHLMIIAYASVPDLAPLDAKFPVGGRTAGRQLPLKPNVRYVYRKHSEWVPESSIALNAWESERDLVWGN